MLDPERSKTRRERLLAAIESLRLDTVVLGSPKTIYYFTATLLDPAQQHALVIQADGKTLLVTGSEPEQAAVDRVATYTGYTIERVFSRTTMHEELAAILRDAVPAGRAGLEFDSVPFSLARALPLAGAENITPAIQQMRRRKDEDELAAIRATIALAEAAYGAIKPRLEPGMTEWEAYSIISAALVEAAQTSVAFGGDFACGCRGIRGGGPPTTRRIERGDLYIFDLFPTYQGYMCDLCRAFIVGTPTQLQQDAWAHVAQAHEIAARLIRPGAAARDVYLGLRQHLERFEPARGSFWHHGGHGVGMEGWEFPWLTPGSDHVIQEGEVIACEPGLYAEALQGGIRLEHDYLVTAEGARALDSFPLDL
ncbi:MAG: aminopeptidase P family protein [Acidobacteria bacterium]|nr:aminopeptidase P family protein [Acidobacteriota bacterium]